MKVAVLDAQTLGSDISLAPLDILGEVTIYPITSPEEVVARIQDVDAIITNKVVLNEDNLKHAKNLKIIALTATGFNNIDIA